ncbi:unnamed protein product [Cylicocyclus nassatus]|uniref:Uncharacterized protein n=1 Tax=Cylicocyclus nassatus TaxID=53992 RepID=A0AA36GC50_CYLNA|nr:unnamed protein product [Cylicocyclus nassatus]
MFKAQQALYGTPRWTSDYGCSKCYIKGNRIERSRVWIAGNDEDERMRSRESYEIDGELEQYGIKKTPAMRLIPPCDFIGDALHVCSEGVTRDRLRVGRSSLPLDGCCRNHPLPSSSNSAAGLLAVREGYLKDSHTYTERFWRGRPAIWTKRDSDETMDLTDSAFYNGLGSTEAERRQALAKLRTQRSSWSGYLFAALQKALRDIRSYTFDVDLGWTPARVSSFMQQITIITCYFQKQSKEAAIEDDEAFQCRSSTSPEL